jgi:hypothetical protein
MPILNGIEEAILLKKVLSIKYWGGTKIESRGTVREVQPYGFKDRSKTKTLTFYGNCNNDNIVKNYALCLIENIYYQGECLISINAAPIINTSNDNEPLDIQQQPFELPNFISTYNDKKGNKNETEMLHGNAIPIKTRMQPR